MQDNEREQILALGFDLADKAEALPNAQQMYDEGIFTGLRNKLCALSPQCSTTLEDAKYWHALGIEYLRVWVKE